MDFNSGIWDILIFAVVAGVLLYRLRSVLGERSEDEPAPFAVISKETQAAVVAAENAVKNTLVNWVNALPNFDWVATATAHHQLAPIAAADPQFHPAEFIDKARRAYVVILGAYSEGKNATLELLLAPALYQAFAEQMARRQAAKETYHVVLHGLKKAQIAGATLDGTNAEIVVDFIAEQSITHKDADGIFIGDGDGRRQTTKDRWVFARDLRSADPIWRLIRTQEMDD